MSRLICRNTLTRGAHNTYKHVRHITHTNLSSTFSGSMATNKIKRGNDDDHHNNNKVKWKNISEDAHQRYGWSFHCAICFFSCANITTTTATTANIT